MDRLHEVMHCLHLDPAHHRTVWVASAVGALGLSYFMLSLFKYGMSRAKAADLARIREAKRKARDAAAKSFKSSIKAAVDPKKALEIRRCTAQSLLSGFKSGAFTCAEAMSVFIGACQGQGLLLNAMADVNFEEAMTAAVEADQRYKNNTARPLEGVPFSVKDMINLKNTDSTCGLAAKCFKPKDTDAVLVTALRQLGAIPVVKGNLPQSLMVPESMNDIFGTACNPWNVERAPGGSSGGEGALIASGCVPMGIGTDIGGSIRIPSHCCGIFGLFPTPGRLSKKGFTFPRKNGQQNGMEHIRGTGGPMARCTEDLNTLMAAWISPTTWAMDVTLPRMPWNREEAHRGIISGTGKPLRVGVVESFSFFEASAPCRRAVKEAAQILSNAGAEVVPFTIPDLDKACYLYYELLACEGRMRQFFDGLEGEDLHTNYKELYRMSKLSPVLRKVLSKVMQMLGQNRVAKLLRISHEHTVWELYQALMERGHFGTKLVNAWQNNNIDVVICPVSATPAFKHNASLRLTPAACYTFLWNLVHFCAGVVPMTTVEEPEAVYEPPAGQKDRFGYAAVDTLKGSEGLPIGVQVVGLPHHDETVIRTMRILEKSAPKLAYPMK